MKRTSPAYFLWVAIPVLTTLNQACVKLLSTHMQGSEFGWEWIMRAVQTPYFALILCLEIISFMFWMAILSHTTISKATPITALVYILILAMSWTAFKEPVMPLQIIGSGLILGGIWLIGTAKPGISSSNII